MMEVKTLTPIGLRLQNALMPGVILSNKNKSSEVIVQYRYERRSKSIPIGLRL